VDEWQARRCESIERQMRNVSGQTSDQQSGPKAPNKRLRQCRWSRFAIGTNDGTRPELVSPLLDGLRAPDQPTQHEMAVAETPMARCQRWLEDVGSQSPSVAAREAAQKEARFRSVRLTCPNSANGASSSGEEAYGPMDPSARHGTLHAVGKSYYGSMSKKTLH
jgi:hypothetical protein